MTDYEIVEARDADRATWIYPVIERAEIMDCGRALGVLLKERDGTVSAIRISVDQLAD